MKKVEAIIKIQEELNDASCKIEKLKLEMFQSEEYLWTDYEVMIARLESNRQKLNEKIEGLKVMNEKKWADSKAEFVISFDALKSMLKDLSYN